MASAAALVARFLVRVFGPTAIGITPSTSSSRDSPAVMISVSSFDPLDHGHYQRRSCNLGCGSHAQAPDVDRAPHWKIEVDIVTQRTEAPERSIANKRRSIRLSCGRNRP
jgi:hypothetical protein